AEMMTDKKPIKVQSSYTSEAPAHKVDEAARLITAAKAPIILAGNGVIRQGAADSLVTFAEVLRIPVANTFMAKGVMPFTNEHSLRSIALHAKPQSSSPFKAVRKAIVADRAEYSKDSGFPMKPQKIVWDLREVLGPDDIAISDVGAHKMWMSRMYRAERPNTCIISNGFAAMGIAVPGAIAAKLAYPDRKVVAVTGDAGFMMNSQEIETAIRV